MPAFRSAPNVTWTVDAGCVQLVSVSRGVLARLPYPDAALWDFVVRGVDGSRTIAMMKHIGGFTDDDAVSSFIDARLREWVRKGWITSV